VTDDVIGARRFAVEEGHKDRVDFFISALVSMYSYQDFDD